MLDIGFGFFVDFYIGDVYIIVEVDIGYLVGLEVDFSIGFIWYRVGWIDRLWFLCSLNINIYLK